jgi:hypothetical protein
MPQIKLAQGFSDIKGKSNGSVFSRNKQGVYFRNNPSGGGKKSDKWNKQKNRFGALSTAWKNLTEVEQQAWSDIAPLYPALNKFGDSYIPSGYQTFMRLNGTINALGYPLLRTPNAPRETPTFDDPEFWIPDLFCFSPTRVAYLGNVQEYMINYSQSDENEFPEPISKDVFATLSIGAVNLFENAGEMNGSYYAVRFVPQANKKHIFSYGQILPLIFIGTTEFVNVQAYIAVKDSKSSILCLSCFFKNDADDTFLYFSFVNIPNSLLESGFHFGLAYDITSDDIFKLYIDGNKMELLNDKFYANPSINPAWVITNNPTPVSKPAELNGFDESAVLTIGFPELQGVNIFNASDFRYISNISAPDWECDDDSECEAAFNEVCVNGWCTPEAEGGLTCADWQFTYMYYGYVLGYESVIIPLNNYVKGKFDSAVGVGREFSMSYVLSVENLKKREFYPIVFRENFVLFQNLHSYIPMVYLLRVDCEVEGFVLNISCTGNVSPGRSLNQVQYKSIGSVPLNSNPFLLSPAMVKNFGSIAENSFYDFKVFLLDTTTGLLGGSPVPSVKKPRRDRATKWKAGSDLSSSVN